MIPRPRFALKLFFIVAFVVALVCMALPKSSREEMIKSRLRSAGASHSRFEQGKLVWLSTTAIETISNSELSHDFSTVKTLDLSGCVFTTQDLSSVSSFSSLQILDVSHSTISDEAIPTLSTESPLMIFRLAHTKITDASIGALLQFKNLRAVDVKGTMITTEGRKRIEASSIMIANQY